VYKVSWEEYYLTVKLLRYYRYVRFYHPTTASSSQLPYLKSVKIPNTDKNNPAEFTFNSLESVLQICEIALSVENDLFHATKDVFFQSLQPLTINTSTSGHQPTSPLPITYSMISYQRQNWLQERERMQNDYLTRSESSTGDQTKKKKRAKVEVITFASNVTEGLQNLLFSSIISGVKLTVLGLNEPYLDYTSKINGYYKYLVSGETSNKKGNSDTTANDDDILLLVDAYDVLLFPKVRQVDEIIMNSRTPIIFCSEAGIYVEFAGMHCRKIESFFICKITYIMNFFFF
jgi:hypothetical protein